MDLQISGVIVAIEDTQAVSDRFSKREFVLETTDEVNGNHYKNYAKMQLVQSKCAIMDRFKVGEEVKVNFNVKGTRWEKEGKVGYITNLDVWRVESTGNQQPVPATQQTPVTQGEIDAIPF